MIYGIEVDTRALRGEPSLGNDTTAQINLLRDWAYYDQAERLAKEKLPKPAGLIETIEKEREKLESIRRTFKLPKILPLVKTYAIDPEAGGTVVEYCPRPRIITNPWSLPTFMTRCIATKSGDYRCSPPLNVDKQCNPRQRLSSFRLGKAVILQDDLNQGNASEERFYRLTNKGLAVVKLIAGNYIQAFDDLSGNTLGSGASHITFNPDELTMHRSRARPVQYGGGPLRAVEEDYRWNGKDFVLISSNAVITGR
jgi:hypothetical protein